MLEKSGEFFFKRIDFQKSGTLQRSRQRHRPFQKGTQRKIHFTISTLRCKAKNSTKAWPQPLWPLKAFAKSYSINTSASSYRIITLILLALGEGLMVPAIYIALRRFNNKRTSGPGFKLPILS
jgi:hypothetical protein